MGDQRLGQKLINYLRFCKGYQREDMQRIIFNLEDDEFQRILDVTILAPPSSDLRIANYQRLLNVQAYHNLKEKGIIPKDGNEFKWE